MDDNKALHGYTLTEDTTSAQFDVLRGIDLFAAHKFLQKSVSLKRTTFIQTGKDCEYYVSVATSPKLGQLRVFNPDLERVELRAESQCDEKTPYVFDCAILRYGLHNSNLANVIEYTETRVAFLAALNIDARLVYLFKESTKKGVTSLTVALPTTVQNMGVSIPSLHSFMGGVLVKHIKALQNQSGAFDARLDSKAVFYPAWLAQRAAIKASVVLPSTPTTPELPAWTPDQAKVDAYVTRMNESAEEIMQQESMETSES